MSVLQERQLGIYSLSRNGANQVKFCGAYYQNVKKTNRIARSLTITYIYMYITSLVAVKFSFVLGGFFEWVSHKMFNVADYTIHSCKKFDSVHLTVRGWGLGARLRNACSYTII